MSRPRAGAAAASLRDALAPARDAGTPPAPFARPAAVPDPAAPPAAGRRASKFTVLLDSWDALAFDGLVLQLRRRLGRRVDKGEVVRVLVGMAEDDPTLLDQVAARLAERHRAGGSG